jgi:hypothetical protein
MPNAGPLGGHWLCGEQGSLTPHVSDMAPPALEPFDVGVLSDLGVCRGDAALSDWVRIEWTGSDNHSITGSVQGAPVQAELLGGASCFSDHPMCSLTVRPSIAGSEIIAYASSPYDSGTVSELQEGAWLAPPGVAADLLCAGPGSTISNDGSRTVIELRGVRALSCPGTSEPGRISGTR